MSEIRKIYKVNSILKNMVKESKTITLGLILSWVFGVLFGIGGLSMLFTGVVVGGGALILASLIILPPATKFTKEKFNFELSRGLKIIAVIVLFIVYAVSASNSGISSVDTYSNNQPAEAAANQAEDITPQNYKLGDRVAIGNFAYTFNSYSTTDKVGQDLMGTFMGEKADGIFLVFDVTIENIAKESKTLWGNNIVVKDDQDRSFEHDTMAEIYLESDDQFIFEQMQPGLPKTGKIVFDVPEDISGYIAVSSDSMWSDEVEYIAWSE